MCPHTVFRGHQCVRVAMALQRIFFLFILFFPLDSQGGGAPAAAARACGDGAAARVASASRYFALRALMVQKCKY